MLTCDPGESARRMGQLGLPCPTSGTGSWYYARGLANPSIRCLSRYDGFAMTHTEDFRGRWALITGASSGIGTALARELASHGAKLILTARRRDRLESLAAELGAKRTETRIVEADLNDPSAPQQIYDASEGAGIHVDILVNNAGLGQYGAFHQNRPEQEAWQVRVNCEAVVRLSRLFVPQMIERRRGWVLIVSSMASFQPMPYNATYAATKAFDRFFSLGLAAEVERFGVKVTALCPGPVETEFFKVARSGGVFRIFGMQTAEEVARKGVAALARGRRVIVPRLKGSLTSSLVRFIPTGLITSTLEKSMRPQGDSQNS